MTNPMDIIFPQSYDRNPKVMRKNMVNIYDLYKNKYFLYNDQTELLPKKLVFNKEEEKFLPKEPYNEEDLAFLQAFNQKTEKELAKRERAQKRADERARRNKYRLKPITSYVSDSDELSSEAAQRRLSKL